MTEISDAVAGMDDRIDADGDDNDVMIEGWTFDHMAVQVHHLAERRSGWDHVRRLEGRAKQAATAGRMMTAPCDVPEAACGGTGRAGQHTQSARGILKPSDATSDFFGRRPLPSAEFNHESR